MRFKGRSGGDTRRSVDGLADELVFGMLGGERQQPRIVFRHLLIIDDAAKVIQREKRRHDAGRIARQLAAAPDNAGSDSPLRPAAAAGRLGPPRR